MSTRKKWLTITRREVLKAIRTEPLGSGNWASTSWTNSITGKKEECSVCLVGGVLRSKLNVPKDFDLDGKYLITAVANHAIRSSWSDETEDYSVTSNPDRAVQAKDWLVALSAKFETTVKTRATPKQREKLATWVKKNIPVSFKIDINGYKPMKPSGERGMG